MKPKTNSTPATRPLKMLVATGGTVGLGVDGVGDEADREEDDRKADVDDEQG